MNESHFIAVLESPGAAMVSGDDDRAPDDSAQEIRPMVIASAGDMPRPPIAAEVLKVIRDGRQWVVHIRFVAQDPAEKRDHRVRVGREPVRSPPITGRVPIASGSVEVGRNAQHRPTFIPEE